MLRRWLYLEEDLQNSVQGSCRIFGGFVLLTFLYAFFLCSYSAAADRGIAITPSPKRIALVVGNGEYAFSPLTNPVNDADDIAAALSSLGFDVVRVVDADYAGLGLAVEKFGDDLEQADVAVFYYAGHGMQSRGRNYLIPVRSGISSEGELPYKALDVGLVLEKMEHAGSRVNVMVILPFLGGLKSRLYAATSSFALGGCPPSAECGRSLL